LQTTRLNAARDVLLRSCLERQGDKPEALGIKVNLDPTRALAIEREADSVLYGITDVAFVRRYGYSPSPTLVAGQAPSPAEESATQPLPNYSPPPSSPPVASTPGTADKPKTSVDGCVRYAQARLFGGQQHVGSDPFGLGQQLAVQAWLSSQDDPRVRAAWADWRTCMTKKGLRPKGNPVDPRMFPTRIGGQQAPPNEVAAGLADIDCKQKVDFVPRWSAVTTQFQRSALVQHRAELQKEAEHLADTLRRAEAILKAAGFDQAAQSPSGELMRVVELTREHAADMVTWRYPPPYDRYSLTDSDPEFFLDPSNGYVALVDDAGELVGYRCFGPDGRVPGGSYDEGALDTGGGLRPALTGQGLGLGRAAIEVGLAYGRDRYAPPAFRITVWARERAGPARRPVTGLPRDGAVRRHDGRSRVRRPGAARPHG
jgi:hypothetical protein